MALSSVCILITIPLKILNLFRYYLFISFFLVIHLSLPFRLVKDLISFAKQYQYELNYAFAGVGTATHIVVELFSYMSGAHMTHVARELGVPLFATAAAHTPYEIALSEEKNGGLPVQDYASISKLWEKWADVSFATKKA